jgi:hypothetical protein
MLKTVTIDLPNTTDTSNENEALSSGSFSTNLFYSYYYVMHNVTDNRILAISTITKDRVQIKLELPINTFFGSGSNGSPSATTFKPQDGFYYIINGTKYPNPVTQKTSYSATSSNTFKVTNNPSNDRLTTTASETYTSSDISISAIKKYGKVYDFNSEFNILSAVENNYTFSFVEVNVFAEGSGTTENNQVLYNNIYVKTNKGEKALNRKNTFNAANSIIHAESYVDTNNFIFAGYYVNGIYADGSYNTPNFDIHVSASTDVVIEARFVQKIKVEINIFNNGNSTNSENYAININATNNYNTNDITAKFGEVEFNASNNIDGISGATCNGVTGQIVVPYGTKLNLDAFFTKNTDSSNKNARWYLNSVSTTNRISDSDDITLFVTKELKLFVNFNDSNTSTSEVKTRNSITYMKKVGTGLFERIEKTEVSTLDGLNLIGTPQTASDSDGRMFIFLGWYKEDNFEMPEEDIVIYGEWGLQSGVFEPTITKKIINKKDSYKKGEVVNFKITITNNETFTIKDVILKELNMDAIYIENEAYKVLADRMVRIDEIKPNSSVEVFVSYQIKETDKELLSLKTQLIGAIADNNYYFNEDKEYVAESEINVIESSSINVPNTLDDIIKYVGLLILGIGMLTTCVILYKKTRKVE